MVWYYDFVWVSCNRGVGDVCIPSLSFESSVRKIECTFHLLSIRRSGWFWFSCKPFRSRNSNLFTASFVGDLKLLGSFKLWNKSRQYIAVYFAKRWSHESYKWYFLPKVNLHTQLRVVCNSCSHMIILCHYA